MKLTTFADQVGERATLMYAPAVEDFTLSMFVAVASFGYVVFEFTGWLTMIQEVELYEYT
ncbi:MAG: hypothetical protein QMC36_04685 [Patescibacteria group bacterium]